MPCAINGNDSFVFVHVPKCGGTSIESILRQRFRLYLFSDMPEAGEKVVSQHLDYRTARDVLNSVAPGVCLENPELSFAVVRSPLARLVSEYRYMFKHSLSAWKITKCARMLGFQKWANEALALASDGHYPDNHLSPAMSFIADLGQNCFDIHTHAEEIETHLSQLCGFTDVVPLHGVQLQGPLTLLNRRMPPVSISRELRRKLGTIYFEDYNRWPHWGDELWES